MKLAPSRRLYCFGATLLVALTICSCKLSSIGEPSFIIPLAVADIAYFLAIREFFPTPRFPRRLIVIGLVFAALWHLPFLLRPAGSDDDVHRYVWDGRVQPLGYNPYIVVPSDPALGALHATSVAAGACENTITRGVLYNARPTERGCEWLAWVKRAVPT